MANKKVENKDIYDPNLWDAAIKGAEELIKNMDVLEERFKQTLKVTTEISKQKAFTDTQDIERRTKAIEDNRKASEALDKIERERVKLQERLKLATDERAKANASLRLQIQEANRANKEAAKIEGDLGPYAQKSATLNKLRKQYKDLAIQYGTNTQEAKALLAEVQQLDKELKELDRSVGQNQRNVGNYVDAVNDLRRSFSLLSKVAIIGVLNELVKTFKSSETGANQFEKALTEVTVRFTVFADAIAQGFKSVEEDANVLEKISQFFEGTGKALDGYEERVQKAIDAQKQLIDDQLESTRVIAAYTVQLSKALREQAKFTTAADDGTLSLDEQRKALNSLQEARTNALTLQLKIANTELEIARQRRQASKEASAINKASAESEREFAEALRTRSEAEVELIEFRAEVSRRGREIARDDAELQLDILIDLADTQKTINERLIADEKLAFDQRRQLLKQTRDDNNATFEEQVELIEKLNSRRLSSIAREKLAQRDALADTKANADERAKLEKEAQDLIDKSASFSINSNDLINESNTKVVNERVRLLGLDEITQTRLLEIIRERRTASQDLTEAERQLNEQQKESNKTQADNLLVLQAIKDLQEENVVLQDVLIQLEKDRLQAEIEAIQGRILNAKAGSQELIDLQAQLYAKLLQQQTERINEEQANEDEATKNRIEAQKKANDLIIGLTEDLINKQITAQEKAIDRELQAVQQRQSQLRAISEQGQADADKAIAFEERREAELLQKKEQQARRRARLELITAGFEVYANKVENDDPNALVNTLTELSVLRAAINALPVFYQGTENVSDSLGLPKIAGVNQDPYLVRVHGGERIVSHKDNALIPSSFPNEALPDAVNMYRAFMDAPMPQQSPNLVYQGQSISKEDLREVMSEAMGKVPVYQGREYNATERAIIDVVKRNGKIERNKRKTGGIW